MKGLVIKDLNILRIQGKSLALVMLVFLFYSVFTNNALFFGGFLTIYSAMLPITILAYDERANWDKYALTMPLSRKDIVTSKYLLGILFPFIALLLNVIFNLAIHMSSAQEILLTSFLELEMGIGFFSILMPIMLKTGVEKGRILMMLIFLVPVALLTMVTSLGMQMPGDEIFQMLAYLSPILVIVLLAASFMLSLNIYRQREF